MSNEIFSSCHIVCIIFDTLRTLEYTWMKYVQVILLHIPFVIPKIFYSGRNSKFPHSWYSAIVAVHYQKFNLSTIIIVPYFYWINIRYHRDNISQACCSKNWLRSPTILYKFSCENKFRVEKLRSLRYYRSVESTGVLYMYTWGVTVDR